VGDTENKKIEHFSLKNAQPVKISFNFEPEGWGFHVEPGEKFKILYSKFTKVEGSFDIEVHANEDGTVHLIIHSAGYVHEIFNGDEKLY
jgi:hypothetical protein